MSIKEEKQERQEVISTLLSLSIPKFFHQTTETPSQQKAIYVSKETQFDHSPANIQGGQYRRHPS